MSYRGQGLEKYRTWHITYYLLLCLYFTLDLLSYQQQLTPSASAFISSTHRDSPKRHLLKEFPPLVSFEFGDRETRYNPITYTDEGSEPSQVTGCPSPSRPGGV